MGGRVGVGSRFAAPCFNIGLPPISAPLPSFRMGGARNPPLIPMAPSVPIDNVAAGDTIFVHQDG